MAVQQILLDTEFYENLLDNLYEGVYFVDPKRRILYWNKAAENLTGYAAGEVLGRHCWDNCLKHINQEGLHLCHASCPLAETMADGSPREAEIYLHHRQGHRVPVLVRVAPIRDSSEQIVGAVELFSDNSPKVALQQMVEDLQQLALIDSLVRLPNRGYLERTLQSSLDEMRRYKSTFGVLFLDIDHFKRINDTYGHDVGDQVLIMVARTLSNALRSFDTLGRWGGEEFVAIIKSVSSEQLYKIASKFRILVEQSSLDVESATVQVTISIGATLAQPGDTARSLLKRADQLLYQSKRMGRNRVSV